MDERHDIPDGYAGALAAALPTTHETANTTTVEARPTKRCQIREGRGSNRDGSCVEHRSWSDMRMVRGQNVRGNQLLDLPERLQEFTENLVDERVPAHGDVPASSSRESASEPRVKGASTVFILSSRRTNIAISACGP